MWPVRLRLVLGVMLVALFAAVGLVFWQARELADARQRESEQSRSLKDVRAHLRELELRVSQGQEEPAGSSAPAGAAAGRYGHSDAVAIAQRDVQISQLHKDLSDARGQAEQLRQRIATFDDEQHKAAASANERFTTAQNDWQNRLNDLTRQLDTARSETQAARQKSADLAKSVEVMKQEASESSARSSETTRLITTLQDLSRRRDAYLTSVLRRYRDVTSQFRAMSGMIDSSRDQASGGLNGPALTRIQSTISMAEDDLRQLNEVNAEAEQVERKLAKR